jgi:hypothetical protein
MKEGLMTTLQARKIFWVLVVAGIAGLFHTQQRASAMPAPQAPNSDQLRKFLVDRNIWGEDALQIFASLDAWKSEGESSILIYTDKVVGGSKFESAEPAQQKAAAATRAMSRVNLRLAPEFASAYKSAGMKKAAVQVEAVRFMEDDSYRLQWKQEGAEFLKKQLMIKAVVAAYGAPEKTETVAVQARGDRRPAVLTISEYAGGSIKFVQSDLSPDPNAVDRVVLDVPAAAAVALASH